MIGLTKKEDHHEDGIHHVISIVFHSHPSKDEIDVEVVRAAHGRKITMRQNFPDGYGVNLVVREATTLEIMEESCAS